MLTKTVEPIEKQLSQSDLKSLPFGQRMLRAGFKIVSEKELEDRLGVTCYNEKQANRAKQKAQRVVDFLNKKRNKNPFIKLLWRGKDKYMIKWGRYRDGQPYYKVAYNDRWELSYKHKGEYYYYGFKEIALTGKRLEEYIDDIIPDRCIESIKGARKLGCKYLHIVTTKEKVYKDPVIIATNEQKIKEPYFEIDMWE